MSRYTGRLPRTFEDAKHMLNGQDDRPIYGVGSTRVRWSGNDTIAVTYHNHEIALFRADGWARFVSAGWATVSTFARVNAMTPPHIRFTKKDFEGLIIIGNEFRGHWGEGAVIEPDGTTHFEQES